MNLILLPGNSKENKEWIYNVEKEFASLFNKRVVVEYNHWFEQKEFIIDLKLEVQNLASTGTFLQRYAIFAKSAGVLLTLYALSQDLIKPEYCIFVGTPINWANKNNFDIDLWIKSLNCPTLFIQKTNDPAASFTQVQKLIQDSELKNADLVEIEGHGHNYENIKELKKYITRFIN